MTKPLREDQPEITYPQFNQTAKTARQGSESRDLPVHLTEEEMLEAAEKVGQCLYEERVIRARLAEYSKSEKEKATTAASLAHKFGEESRTGARVEKVPCSVFYDFGANQRLVVRDDTKQIVDSRTLSVSEVANAQVEMSFSQPMHLVNPDLEPMEWEDDPQDVGLGAGEAEGRPTLGLEEMAREFRQEEHAILELLSTGTATAATLGKKMDPPMDREAVEEILSDLKDHGKVAGSRGKKWRLS